MGSIIVMSGSQEGDYYPLGRRTTVIGRDEGLPIQILDEHVSRKHLQIRFDKVTQQYKALDMKSRQGVFINGNRISVDTPLADDDEVHIGRTTLLFTTKDFPDHESALTHFKKVGERKRSTVDD